MANNVAVWNSTGLLCTYIGKKPHRIHSKIHSLKVYKKPCAHQSKRVAQFPGEQHLDELHTKNNHDGQVRECRCIKIHSQTSLCFCYIFFVFFQTTQAILSFNLLEFFQDRQVRLIVVFLKYFSLIHLSQQRQLTEKNVFSFPFCLHSFV